MICRILKTPIGFSWFYNEDTNNSQTCILAIHFNKEINVGSLLNYRKHGLISLEDYRAIRRFDVRKGTDADLKQIKDLANHLGNISVELLA
jgi:hypothetical protein